MQLKIEFEDSDIQAVQDIVRQRSHRRFVAMRVHRNVSGPPPNIDEQTLWHTHMMCLLTTQQSSSPGSPINQILNERPFRLSLEHCRTGDVSKYVQSVLQGVRGIRFAPKIARQTAENLSMLKSGGWAILLDWSDKLRVQRLQSPIPEHYQLEREAASYMDKTYKGFGPKQSRNFWQSLGLMRYEFVLDSRVLRWLRGLNVPLPMSSMCLGEEDYYLFVSDILRELCIKADVLPCVLDAAVFDSADTEEWSDDTTVW
jgi:thermostable 8-oxoguanine DNA glycosylase